MIRILQDVNVDWLGKRRILIGISVVLLLAGLASAVIRQQMGTGAFNLGVDFQGGTLVTVRFPEPRPSEEAIRAALAQRGMGDAIVQRTDRPDEVLIKISQRGAGETEAERAQADAGRAHLAEAIGSLGVNPQEAIIATDSVGPIASHALRNQAIAVTLLALVGILLYMAFRFEWTYGAAAVITVFHDVLVTLGFFSIFQWEIDLTVIAGLLTLVGFSVNDTIVIFDRVRENLRLRRRESLYKLTNDAVNQTLSRTIITSGTTFLSVLALVLFGGPVLRGFALALLIGVVVGSYSTIAAASPIMVWLQQRVDAARAGASPARGSGGSAAQTKRAPAAGPRTASGREREPQGATRS